MQFEQLDNGNGDFNDPYNSSGAEEREDFWEGQFAGSDFELYYTSGPIENDRGVWVQEAEYRNGAGNDAVEIVWVEVLLV